MNTLVCGAIGSTGQGLIVRFLDESTGLVPLLLRDTRRQSDQLREFTETIEGDELDRGS